MSNLIKHAEEELKPCPWCEDASDITVFERKHKLKGYIVNCITCGTSSWAYQSKEEAIEAWNSIAKPTFTKEDLEKATKAAFSESGRVSFDDRVRKDPTVFYERIVKAALKAVGRVEE